MSDPVTNEWMQEYERLLQAYKGAIINYYAVPDYYSGPDMAEAHAALDAHVRSGLTAAEQPQPCVWTEDDG